MRWGAVAAVAGGLLIAAAPPSTALDPATIFVPTDLRDGRVLLVRPQRIDVVTDGRVARVVPLAGALDLARLPALVGDPAFASSPRPGVVRLGATLAQRPGSRVVGDAPSLVRLQLADAARLIGTRAQLQLRGTTIEPGAAASGGASIRYTHGSELHWTGVTVRRLGTTVAKPSAAAQPDVVATPGASGASGPAAPGASGAAAPGTSGGASAASPAGSAAGTGAPAAVGDDRAAVEADGGSRVRLVRVRIAGATGTGLRLHDVAAASFVRVVVENSGSDGIALRGGTGVSMSRVTVRGNRGNGMHVRGPVSRLRIGGPITATGNHGTGVLLSELRGAELKGLTTGNNAGAGVHLRASTAIELADLTSSTDISGVTVTGSRDVRLADVTSGGSASGVVVKDSETVAVTAASVSGAADEGFGLQGRGISLAKGTVTTSGEGVVVGAGSARITVRDSTLNGERTALRIAPETTGVEAQRVVARALDAVAVRSGGSGTTLSHVVAEGAVGFDLRGSASVANAKVTATGRAMRVTHGGRVNVRDSTLSSRDLGIAAADGTFVSVSGSKVLARHAIDGDVTFTGGNDVSAQPIRWVGIAGLVAMTLAVGLELLRKTRERSDRWAGAPLHVLNRT